jgi:hypothetical protein
LAETRHYFVKRSFLLQTRTLDGTLRDLFTGWYPAMAANDNEVALAAAAA